jgi:plasmid stabilization system protein ParE
MPFVPDQQQSGGAAPRGRFVPAGPAPKTQSVLRRLGMIPVGIGEAALSVGTGMVSAPINDYVAGMAEAEPGGRDAQSVMANPPVGTYQPRSDSGKAILGWLGNVMEPAGKLIDAGTDVNNPDPEVRATGHLLRGTLGVIPGLSMARRGRVPARATPSISELKAGSQAAYAAAEKAGQGKFVPQNDLAGFASQVEQKLTAAGAREKLHPSTFAALDEVMQEATRPGVAGSSFQGMETMRRVLQSAENSAKTPDDGRLAGQILDDFDAFIDAQDPAVGGLNATAREMWSRMRKAETIQGVIERAKNSSPSLTQSGMENALRQQFRQLADNPRRMRSFSQEERAAILRVVRGTTGQNITRGLGKLAIRGPVSGGVTLGVGNAIAGPVGAVALAGVGEATKLAATLMRLRDVRRVDEAVRNRISRSRKPAPSSSLAISRQTLLLRDKRPKNSATR